MDIKNLSIKELVKNDNIAILTHIISGVAYYEVNIPETDKKLVFTVDMTDSNDVGTATFEANTRAITLMRWIRKSISNETAYIK